MSEPKIEAVVGLQIDPFHPSPVELNKYYPLALSWNRRNTQDTQWRASFRAIPTDGVEFEGSINRDTFYQVMAITNAQPALLAEALYLALKQIEQMQRAAEDALRVAEQLRAQFGFCSTDEEVQLRAENERLRAENEQLRAEKVAREQS